MLGQEGGHGLGFMGREIIDNQMGISRRAGWVKRSCSKKAMNSALVCREAVLPRTSPVAVLSAA